MEIQVLGPVAISIGGDSLPVGGPKPRTVLALLIANHGQVVSVEMLVRAVYGDDAPARRRRAIQTYVSSLRAEMGDAIVKRGAGWTLAVDGDSIDAARFEELVDEAKQLKPDAASEVLREALALWQGHPYVEIEAHGHLDAEILRLQELRLSALEARIDADLALGRHGDLVAEMAALLAEYPYRERFRFQHMLALYRAGRQREALASYQEMRGLLVAEIGADPSAELQQLESHIIAQDSALDLPAERSIKRRAVLVADLGDPLELARAPGADRELLLARTTSVLHRAAEEFGDGECHVAGTANYVVFDSAHLAASAAVAVANRLARVDLRIAIDWGDIEVDEDGISGPPVSRSAAIVAAAHPGQLLISSEAHRELIDVRESAGIRFEALGTHDLPGVESPTGLLQVLVGRSQESFPELRGGRLPPPLPSGRYRAVPGYELREPLGEGSVGSLYRAYQPSVGREVIVEVIDRSIASDPDFIRHFEADAQRLALLDHPHIDPLLDYWREPDGAFLVYRSRRGGLLSSAAAATPQLLDQIASALAYAHSYGVVHGSVRPDRILLDESGFGYLIAFAVGKRRPRSSAEHAAYIAPEMIAGAAPSVAGDIYALAVLAHEIEAGAIDGDRPLAPDQGALARALSENPAARQGSVDELLAALDPRDRERHRLTEVRNPYKGLAAFHESDAADFFGRSALTAALSAKLAESGFVAVVGPSGVGKSSLVRAGLIPAVRAGGIDGSERWVITDMLPGAHPFVELRRALERVIVDLHPPVIEGLVQCEPDALADLDRALPDGAGLLLVMDQAEELFTMCEESVARRFVDLLVHVVESKLARVVLTLRADFLDRPLRYSAFGELIADHLFVVATPNRDELAEAITGPANSVGILVEADLVERICADVHDRPGALPLLQHGLVELFESRTADQLTLAGYESIGGVTGSLERRAEATFAALDAEDQARCRRTMLSLLTVVDDGSPLRRRVPVRHLDEHGQRVVEAFVAARLLVNDIEPETRTPTVEVAHEALLIEWPRLADWVDSHRSELLQRARLTEAAAEWDAADRSSDLLLSDGRLAQHQAWVNDSDLVLADTERELLAASRLDSDRRAARAKRRRTLIMSGFGAAALVAGVLAVLAISAGREADSRRADAEQAEASALAEALRADENAAKAQANATEAEQNESRADAAAADAEENAALAEASAAEARASTRVAEGRALVAAVPNVVEEDPQLALLLSIEAADRLGDVPEATSALHETLAAQRTVYRTEWLGSFGDGSEVDGDLSADGKLLAVVGSSGATVEVHDVDRGEPLWSYTFPVERPQDHQVMARFVEGRQELLLGLSWHPGSDRAFDTPSPLLGFHVVDSRTGELLRRSEGGPCGPVGAFYTRWAILFESAVSKTMTVGISQAWFDEHGCWPAYPRDRAGSPYPEVDIMRVDLATGESVPVLAGWDGGVIVAAMSADGTRAGLGWNGSPPGTFTVIDIDSGEVVNVIDKQGRAGGSGLFLDLDGSRAVTQGATDGEILHFDVESGELLAVFEDPGGPPLTNAGFSSDNSRYYTTDIAGTLSVFSADGDVEGVIPVDGPIAVVRGTRDLDRVATFGTSRDRAVTVLDLGGAAEVAAFDPCSAASLERRLFLNRGLVAHEDLLTVMALCDAAGTENSGLPIGSTDGASWSPGYAYTYSVDDGELVARHQALGQTFAAASGSTAVMQTWSGDDIDTWVGGEVAVVDLRTGEQTAVLDGLCALPLTRVLGAEPTCDGEGLAFSVVHLAVSPDGTIVAVAGDLDDAKGRAWNRASGTAIDLPAPIGALGISPDGSVLVVIEQFDTANGGLGVVRLYRTSDFDLITEVAVSPEVVAGDVVFAPNGETFAALVGDPATAVRVHDAETGEVIERRSDLHEGLTRAFVFSADSTRIATVATDGFARVWDATTFRLLTEIDVGGFVNAVSFVDADRNLAVATRSGDVRIYHLELDDMLDLAYERVRRGFTPTECSVYFPDTTCPTYEEILNRG